MSTSFGWEGKGRYGSFRYQMNVGCAGKTVRSLENAYHTWAPYGEALYKFTFTFTFTFTCEQISQNTYIEVEQVKAVTLGHKSDKCPNHLINHLLHHTPDKLQIA